MSMIRWLVTKDIRCFLSDRNGAILTFCVPMILAMLLSLLFAPHETATELTLAVIDQDGSAESKALVEAIGQQKSLNVLHMTEDDAREQIREGELTLAVILPEGTGAKLTPLALFSGDPLPTTLLHDPSKKMEADLCEGLLTQVVMQEVGRRFSDPQSMRSMLNNIRAGLTIKSLVSDEDKEWVALLDEGMKLIEPTLAESEDDAEKNPMGEGMKMPIAISKESVHAQSNTEGYNTYSHNFAGMLCMFLMFWALDAGKELIQERDSGVLVRIRSTPVSIGHVLTARAISAMLVALGMTVCVYGLGMIVFDVEILGSVAGFLLVLLAQALFIGGMAVLLAGVGRTERQVTNLGGFVVLIMSFLGGAWMPSFVLPDWVQSVAQLLPSYWSTQGLAAMTWRGLPLESALIPAGILAFQGIVCALIGWRAYRWN